MLRRYFDPMMEPKAMDGDLREKPLAEIEEVVHDTVDAHMIADVEVGSSAYQVVLTQVMLFQNFRVIKHLQ